MSDFRSDDGGGSLMAEMNALFAPPGGSKGKNSSGGSQSTVVELHPYYKRPGKGHNHDCCDACGEGGDLICCDGCPASFHLTCHAPPLDEEDLPIKGDWLCLKCHYKQVSRNGTIQITQKMDALSTCTTPTETSSETTQPEKLTPAEIIEPAVPTCSRPTRSRRAAAASASSAVQVSTPNNALNNKVSQKKIQENKQMKIYRNKYNAYLAVKPKTNSPFDALIAAVQVNNAEEFSLPKELETKETLPFSWKWADERQDDFDTYPKNCQNCQKTSRGVPALGCDFCGSVYHLDCLDPPLCEIPKERWMCPAHVEHHIDSHVVQSTSLSKRLKLWNKYARVPVDTDAIRIEFFRKIRSGRRGADRLQRQQKIPLTNRVVVPEYIKTHYKSPLPGFPIEGDIPIIPREETEEEWAATLISLQTSVLQHQKQTKNVPKNKTEKTKIDITNGDNKSERDDEDTISNCSLKIEEEDDDDVLDEDTRNILNEYIGKNHKRGVDRLCPLVKEFLALQKIKDIFPDKSAPPESTVQGRASLVPLNVSSRVPCVMRYRTLDIGLGPSYGLDLSQYGHCNFVSSKTASIFFDQYSRIYELINYSEHGIIVDHTVYGLNTPPPPKNVKKKATKANCPKMSAFSAVKPCHCSTSIVNFIKTKRAETNSDFNINCENSAVLHHGSYIRFGCLQFVFSEIDFDTYGENDAQKTKSGEKGTKVITSSSSTTNSISNN